MARFQDSVQQGIRADQPVATAVGVGTLYGVTDEGDIIERSDGAAWQAYSPTIGASSGFVLLEQHTAATTATLDFTTFISSTYDTYEFQFVNLLPTVDGDLLWMRMGTGVGPTWDSGANYSYRYWRMAGATAVVAAAGGTKIILTDAVDDAVLYGIVGTLRLYSPQSTTVRKMVNGQLFFEQTAAGGFEEDLPMGVYDSTTAITGVRFLFSSSTAASGTIRVYGLLK